MLLAHINAVEGHLLEISKIPANSGHTLHKGTPREAFIKEFLQQHLSSTVSIGSGEIIDSQSAPGQQRNQFDIVIYKRNYPKLDFGGGISGFLAESVLATIEVRSLLDQAGIEQAAKAAHNIKGLTRNLFQSFHAGYLAPAIASYVVAYVGPAQIKTVHGWIKSTYELQGIAQPKFEPDKDRTDIPSPALDGVYVLGLGFCNFINMPTGFVKPEMLKKYPDARWEMCEVPRGALLSLFLNITTITSNVEGAWLNPLPYLTNFHAPNLTLGD